MKKYPFIPMVLLGMMTVMFSSCEKESTSQDKNEENIILFEDRSMLENISPNFYDNHIYRVELLGNNDELCELLSAISDEGLLTEQLNIYGAKKHLFNHSSVSMYSMPYTEGDNKVIVYQYENEWMVMKAQSSSDQEEGLYRLTSTDGQLHYSMQVNQRGEIRNIVTKYNPKFEQFNAKVYRLSQEDHIRRHGTLKTREEDCCRRAANWSGCMDCTMTAFVSTWSGRISLALFGKDAIAAIAISCINAGPTAVC